MNQGENLLNSKSPTWCLISCYKGKKGYSEVHVVSEMLHLTFHKFKWNINVSVFALKQKKSLPVHTRDLGKEQWPGRRAREECGQQPCASLLSKDQQLWVEQLRWPCWTVFGARREWLWPCRLSVSQLSSTFTSQDFWQQSHRPIWHPLLTTRGARAV